MTTTLLGYGHEIKVMKQLYWLSYCGERFRKVANFIGISRGMNGVALSIVTPGEVQTEDSGAVRNASVSALNCIAQPKSPAILVCLGVDPLDMPKTPYQASEGNSSKSLLYVIFWHKWSFE